jgi:hypothetical protein
MDRPPRVWPAMVALVGSVLVAIGIVHVVWLISMAARPGSLASECPILFGCSVGLFAMVFPALLFFNMLREIGYRRRQLAEWFGIPVRKYYRGSSWGKILRGL